MEKRGVPFFFLGFLCLFSWGSVGMAADYPERTIRMIVPYGAGSGNDFNARAIQPFFEKILGQKVVVDCIPAGSTKIGTMELMKAKPDGYTLLLNSAEVSIGLHYSGTFDSKIWEQMTPFGSMTKTAYALFEVRGESPYKAWADLVKAAKENPGKLTCGTPVAGGMNEVIMNDISKATGIKVRLVPFASSPASGTALYGGHIDFRLTQPSVASTMLLAKKTRGLAVSLDERLKMFPDIPTFKELGIGGSILLSAAIWGPPKLPANIVNTLTKIIQKTTEDPGYIKIMEQRSQVLHYRSPEELKAHMENFDKEFGPKLAETYK